MIVRRESENKKEDTVIWLRIIILFRDVIFEDLGSPPCEKYFLQQLGFFIKTTSRICCVCIIWNMHFPYRLFFFVKISFCKNLK